ncbi:tRNA (adenosine(37)-N6)-threonylcarbamoyltransferase complex dimerization subunit type 1 TsaB [Weissella viridescens]|uniref:tRNA (Adenosine(37)-N6)-threonylcarbamoyltransferase complex dimerization subunit type 1 TsaB n=1 Tax=Weissella viridescens TaxID=1629 RepID=A0A3P2RCX5_WEIVI|nr:tRNA (adenosine(37)-N6)-threonylcarbamoyltransferase complex dimerization subunit type 1 TsaB [Weissella viridescens]RRG18589.1 tRNA (adenosine(37)-N6)-threonylcarbamoyltransferase complex dimerization subunit type 1 TsaB [Weissella viridescens]
MGKTLAFDTSNQALSVAIFEDGALLAQREANVARNHSGQLLPFIDELTKAAGWQPADLDRVVVSQGPGSYTGLRIGVTTAKTLAFTLNLELAGISSLALLAANVTDPKKVIVPIMDARNQNLYAGAYQWQNGELVPIITDEHSNLDVLTEQLAQLHENLTFTGEYANFQDELEFDFPTAEFAEDVLPHASHLPELVQAADVLTDMDDIHRFVPKYHRLSQAEADWARAHPDAGDADYVEKL